MFTLWPGLPTKHLIFITERSVGDGRLNILRDQLSALKLRNRFLPCTIFIYFIVSHYIHATLHRVVARHFFFIIEVSLTYERLIFPGKRTFFFPWQWTHRCWRLASYRESKLSLAKSIFGSETATRFTVKFHFKVNF